MCFANVNDITEIMPEKYLPFVAEFTPLAFRKKSVEKKRYMRIKYI